MMNAIPAAKFRGPIKTPYTVLSPIHYIHTYLIKIMWLTLHVRVCSVVSNAYNSDHKGMID